MAISGESLIIVIEFDVDLLDILINCGTIVVNSVNLIIWALIL